MSFILIITESAWISSQLERKDMDGNEHDRLSNIVLKT
jgi:hypothetical protein